jgi:hypothetical protein
MVQSAYTEFSGDHETEWSDHKGTSRDLLTKNIQIDVFKKFYAKAV